VYLFAGENFGINVAITNDQISRVTYQRDIAKADVEFKFTQEDSPNGPMMMLVTRNKLKHKLFFDALMTVPNRKEVYKTNVLPVERALSNFESWPHPIVQLVLRNFRFSEKALSQGGVTVHLVPTLRFRQSPVAPIVPESLINMLTLKVILVSF
jgi:hypothetical protein